VLCLRIMFMTRRADPHLPLPYLYTLFSQPFSKWTCIVCFPLSLPFWIVFKPVNPVEQVKTFHTLLGTFTVCFLRCPFVWFYVPLWTAVMCCLVQASSLCSVCPFVHTILVLPAQTKLYSKLCLRCVLTVLVEKHLKFNTLDIFNF